MDIAVILLFWLLALSAFFSNQIKWLIYLFFCSMSFGSFAVVTPALTGGLSLTATPIVALLIILKVALTLDGRNFFISSCLSRPLNWLFYFWLFSLFVTYFSPRFFNGEILVIPVRDTRFMRADFLQPTAQNFSQIAYLTISIFTVFAFSYLLRNANNRFIALRGILWGGAVVVFTGFLDLLSQYVTLDYLLEPFRNATYAFLTNAEVLGSKRIVGLMPEASSYGGLSITFFSTLYFLKANYLDTTLKPVIYLLIATLLLMVWLSTSSAAYVALGVFSIIIMAELFWKGFLGSRNYFMQSTILPDVVLILSVAIVALTLYAFVPDIFDNLYELVDTMVLKKTESDSYMERTFWTSTSWQALLDTWGIGVGAGGTRASNGLVAIISNTGVLGAFFYSCFLWQIFINKRASHSEYNEALFSALKWSFIPPFVADTLTLPTPDFGLFNAFRYGMLTVAILTLSTNKPLSPTGAS